MFKLDASRAFSILREGRRSDLHRRVHQFKNALTRGHRRLKDVVLLAQILDGAEKTLRILHEGNQYSQCCRASDDIVPAKPNDGCDCDGRQDFNDWIIKSVSEDSVLERLHMHCIGSRKLFECAAFAIEQLQHHHAGYVLLQKGVDARNRYSDATIRVA